MRSEGTTDDVLALIQSWADPAGARYDPDYTLNTLVKAMRVRSSEENIKYWKGLGDILIPAGCFRPLLEIFQLIREIEPDTSALRAYEIARETLLEMNDDKEPKEVVVCGDARSG